MRKLILLFLLFPSLCYAAVPVIDTDFRAWDSDSNLLAGGCLYTYDCGTSTKATTYSDRGATSANTNPITLDSTGKAAIYSNQCLKLMLYTADDSGTCTSTPSTTLLRSKDYVYGLNAPASLQGVSLDETYDCDIEDAVTTIEATNTYTNLVVDCDAEITAGQTVSTTYTDLTFDLGGSISGAAGGATFNPSSMIDCPTGHQCIDSTNLTLGGSPKFRNTISPTILGAGLDNSTDDYSYINTLITWLSSSASGAWIVKPNTYIIDFGGKTAAISDTVVMKTGVYLANGALRATASMDKMVETANYDAWITEKELDDTASVQEGNQEYFTGFLGDFVINADAQTMNDGIICAIVGEYLTIDHLAVNGRDDNQDELEDTLAFFLGSTHPSTQPRTFFASTHVHYLKTAHTDQGMLLMAPDAVYDYLEAQYHADYGINWGTGAILTKAHIYGVVASQGSGDADRGYAFLLEGGTPSAAVYGTPTLKGNPYIEAETSDYGVVYSANASGSFRGSATYFVYKNIKADLLAEDGTGAISTDINLIYGTSTNASYPYARGIYFADPTDTYFYANNVSLNNYYRQCAFRGNQMILKGELTTDYSSSDGQSQTDETNIELYNSIANLTVRTLDSDDTNIDFRITGYYNDINLVGLIGTGTTTLGPNFIFGETGGISIKRSKVVTNGSYTTDIEYDENYNDYSFQKGVDSAIYDFDVDGGSVSTIALGRLPDNATITRAWYEVLTAPTSGGPATIAFGVNTNDADGLLAATAYDDAVFGLGYHTDFDPDGTAANFTTKTTAARNVSITIDGAALTAGKIRIWYEWVASE